jgi:hypothetical protein
MTYKLEHYNLLNIDARDKTVGSRKGAYWDFTLLRSNSSHIYATLPLVLSLFNYQLSSHSVSVNADAE